MRRRISALKERVLEFRVSLRRKMRISTVSSTRACVLSARIRDFNFRVYEKKENSKYGDRSLFESEFLRYFATDAASPRLERLMIKHTN